MNLHLYPTSAQWNTFWYALICLASAVVLILSAWATVTSQTAPVLCKVSEPQITDGMTQKEHSLTNTVLTCANGTYHVPRTSYTFDNCKEVTLQIIDGVLVPVSDEDCKVGRVADCQRAIKAKRGQYGSRVDFMNLAIPECENVELTNSLIDGS